jgi:hypothetical protein
MATGPILTRGHRPYAEARQPMTEPIPLSCPYCGEPVELDFDETGGARQAFVQDCPVCCQPWQVEVVLDRDGEWNATLRTADE